MWITSSVAIWTGVYCICGLVHSVYPQIQSHEYVLDFIKSIAPKDRSLTHINPANSTPATLLAHHIRMDKVQAIIALHHEFPTVELTELVNLV
jgi:hypothetical protein